MTYWHYTFIVPRPEGGFIVGWGVANSFDDDFDFISFYRKYPNYSILNLSKVSKEQFDKLNGFIEEQKQKEK